jgi:uncharacterized protein YdaU (DUF1376 family)
MPVEAIGAYWLLVSFCWLEGGLPQNPRLLAAFARVDPGAFDALWSEWLEPCFYLDSGGRWQHRRLDEERAKQAKYRRAMQINGRKGGRPKESRGLAAGKPQDSRTKAEKSSPIFDLQSTNVHAEPNVKIAHQGPRLTVWKWQHEDLGKRLGSKPFDLLGWYSKLEAELEKTGESLADPWRWLISRLVRDAGLEYPNLYGKPGRRPNEPCPAGHTPPCVSVEACRERRQAEREAARAAKAAQA